MPALAFGLNTSKKSASSKPAPPKRKPAFGAFGGADSDDEDAGASNAGAQVEQIGGDLDDFDTSTQPNETSSRKPPKPKNGLPKEPPKMKSKVQPNAMFGDLSSSLSSKRAAESATTLDSSVYEYDNVYDSLKPAKAATSAEKDRKPRYMRGLMEAADIRKRDALIAEEKKIAREREAEGDEFAGKEKFVTEAYKRQQEENKKIEEEERKREEREAKKNEGGGMSGFYKDLLKREGERHNEVVKAVEESAKEGPKGEPEDEEMKDVGEEAKRIKDLQDKGADVAVNEDGQVVDKRQLLKGGLNLGNKPKPKPQEENKPTERERKPQSGQHIGSRQAQRERQSRMLAEQLEASMKRDRDEEEEKREEIERQAKSRKTEGEISSAKERYLARKRAAEEAKKGGEA